jgi:dUTP pyrophosphatase
MSKKQITVSVVNKGSNPLPTFTKEGDACVDLRADFTNGFNDDLGTGAAWDDVSKCVRLFSGGRCVIPTGLYTAFDDQHMLKILQRSGLALKSGIIPLGGVIDSGYRNEIGVILVNISDDDFEIRQGDRIAQAALIPIERFAWKEFDALEDSDRGKSGLGASGIK